MAQNPFLMNQIAQGFDFNPGGAFFKGQQDRMGMIAAQYQQQLAQMQMAQAQAAAEQQQALRAAQSAFAAEKLGDPRLAPLVDSNTFNRSQFPNENRAGMQPIRAINPETGKVEYYSYDKNTGTPTPTGLAAENRPDYGTSWLGRMQAGIAAGVIRPDITPEEYLATYEAPGNVRGARLAVDDPNVTQGTQDLAAAGTRGSKSEERLNTLRSARDELYINVIPQLDMMYEGAEQMLAALKSGEGQYSVPVIGSMLASLVPTIAEMQQYSAGEALQNLQIVKLTPVSNEELKFIQTLAASPNALTPVNIKRLEGTLTKLVRNKALIQRKLKYLDSELGITGAAPEGDSEQPDPLGLRGPTQ